jgi:hypothetical protein
VMVPSPDASDVAHLPQEKFQRRFSALNGLELRLHASSFLQAPTYSRPVVAGAGFVTGTATTGRLRSTGCFCGRHRCTRPTKASGPKDGKFGPRDGDTVQCCRPAWRGYIAISSAIRYFCLYPGAKQGLRKFAHHPVYLRTTSLAAPYRINCRIDRFLQKL